MRLQQWACRKHSNIAFVGITASIIKKNGCDYSILMLAKPVTL